MQLKHFRTPTVREGLVRVRREMGPQALVISTRLVPMVGWQGWFGRREVEVTASSGAPMSGDRRSAPDAPARAASAATTERATSVQSSPPQPAAPPKPPSRSVVVGAGGGPLRSARASSDEMLIAQLCATGLDRTISMEAARALPKSKRRLATPESLVQALAAQLLDVTVADEPFAKVEVFVGPPGVGKTTTIAKIAAQARARTGRRLALVGADAFRLGAVEQLRAYAAIIGSPFEAARSAAELDAALRGRRVATLVDTAGRSPHDAASRAVFEALAARAGVRTHLVLPATAGPREAARIFDIYGLARPTRVVLTRLDEAESCAPLLASLKARGLRVSYLSDGQRVPEDLRRAAPSAFAAALLGVADHAAGSNAKEPPCGPV